MATATTIQSFKLPDLVKAVGEGAEMILNLTDEASGAALPEAGELPCTKCEGTGGSVVKSEYHPKGEYFSRCYVCHGKGWHAAPQLDLILAGIFTDHRGPLRHRAGYGLSPSDLKKKGANETTVDLYEFIRARYRFDTGRNYNIGGMVMTGLHRTHPYRWWAEAVNAALLILSGRSKSAGAARWEAATGGWSPR